MYKEAMVVKKILLLVTVLLVMDISEAHSIILAPGIVEFELMPGGAKVFTLNVTNKVGAKPARCKIYVSDVEILRDGKIEYPQAGTVKYSCANWIEVSPKELYLKGGEVKKVNCEVLVPPGIIGSRAAAIICELIPDIKIEKEAAAIIHLRIASIVKLNIGSGLKNKLEIFGMDILKEKEETAINVVLKNEGNTTLVPKGTLSVKNKEGRIFTKIPLVSTTYTMFPGDIRHFKAIFKENLPDGEYIAEAELKYGKKERLINRWNIVVTDGIITKKLDKGESITEEFLQFSTKPSSIDFHNLPQRVFRAGVIQVYNDDSEPIHLDVEIKDISIDSDGQVKYLELGTTSYSCNGLISLFPTSVNIGSKKQGFVKYTIKIPDDAEGGKYGAILFKATSSSKRIGESIVPIGMDILDTLKEELELSELKVSSHVKQLKISLLLKNKGNVRLKPVGKIIIKDKGNKVVDEILLKKDIDIFPTQTRNIEIFHSHNLPTGNYTAEVEIKYGDKMSVIETKEFFVKRR